MAPIAQRGFVLVATVWILAIITIAAGYFAERVNRSIALAKERQETTEHLLAFADTRANILFRLGTTPLTPDGLGQPAIALDDRPYRGARGDVIRLQDTQGLLKINFSDPPMMRRFLEQLGVPVEKRDALIDALSDYIDLDDLRRLNGAEAAEYAALNLPPPPNDWLAAPHQLKNIIGWRDQTALWQNHRLTSLVTTSRIGVLNPNTAPLEVLASLPGSNLQIAAAIIKARNARILTDHSHFLAFLGNSQLNPDFITFFPGRSVRITQQADRLPWAVEYCVTLTPQHAAAPWRVDYYIKTALSYPVENQAKIPSLPERAQATPDGKPAL